MRNLVLCLLLVSCAKDPIVNHAQCDWRSILYDPLMNQLMDQTPIPSSVVANVYVELRGLQLRSQLLQTHLCNQEKLISLTSELVKSGVASSIDLQTLILFEATLKGELFKLQTNLDKLLYQLAPLVKENPWSLANRLCGEGPLPIKIREVVSGSCQDLLSYSNNEERVSLFIQTKDSAQTSYSMTKDLFERGLKSSVDLISAHKALITAEDELVQAQVDELNDYITLFSRY